MVRPSAFAVLTVQLDSCGLLDRQIGWFLVFENAPGIDTSNIK
jgi:hypothetical protein